ncbi:hypothetical protein A3C28_06565 [Candidatus Roizmanbacteria bacterium RIFCSPHIGHO2_02_FULL_39_9]|uniref:AI-2E family transporter n=1 Tax=Candidatus Roizmanbacteria bacterium RIFCSPHIGHO2_02_FULL_39_9 TaxID=1802040 RepID=A0A1F7H3I4_9BACT|nr:MAG: hypothetical protein A3C28_06565 [Candidatus Roizmanbacteria bacterium RIFCSPHIGHO2_02_FULL_39_9]
MQKIEISSRTIIFTIVFILLLQFIWLVKDIIFSLFIAFIIMSAFKPYVNFLTARKVPRFLAAAFIYIIFVLLVFGAFFLMLPPLITETTLLIRILPTVIERVAPNLATTLDLNQIFQYLPNIANQFFDVVSSIFSNTVFIITTLFFGFYFLIEEDVIRKIVVKFFDTATSNRILTVFDKAEKRLSSWFWGQVSLMTIVGLMTYVGLQLLGMRYVLALAVLAGILEAIPNLGPTLSAVPSVLIAFSISPVMGLAVLALYFVVQQIENNLAVPIIMKRAVGLSPIITLIALLVGGRIGGVLGVLLAIPITVFLETMIIEVLNAQKKPAVNPR